MAVYIVGPVGGPYKIGTSTNYQNRIATLQTASPVELELIAVYEGGIELERQLHERLAGCRIRGEWFTLTGEEFKLIKEIAEKHLYTNAAAVDIQETKITVRQLVVNNKTVSLNFINQLPISDYRVGWGTVWGWYIVPGCTDCFNLSPQSIHHNPRHIKFIFEQSGQLYRQTAFNPEIVEPHPNTLSPKQWREVIESGQIFL